jgi:hypothetical protein
VTLQTQIVPLVIAGGLAEQVDELAVEGGAWLTLSNLVYDKAGVLSKRSGYGYLPNNVRQGGTLLPVSQLATLRGQLLAVCDGTHGERPGLPHSHAWSEATGVWVRQDDVCPASIERGFLLRGLESVENPQLVASNDRVLVSWLDAGLGLSFKLLDKDGVVLLPDATIESYVGVGLGPESASSSRLVMCGTTAVWVYVNSATFELQAINYDTITGAFGPVVVLEAPFVSAFFDAVAVSGSEFVLALRVGTGIDLRRINALSLATAASSFQPAFLAPGTIGIAREDGTGNLSVVTLDNATDIRGFAVTSAFGAVWGPITFATPTGPVDRVSIGFLADGGALALWSGQDGASIHDRGLFTRRVDSAGAFVGTTRTTWHVDLYSRPWLQDGQAFVLAHGSFKDAYYLLCVDHTANPGVAHLLEGYCAINEASGLKLTNLFPLPDATPIVPLLPDGRWQIPIQVPAAVTNNQEQRGLDLAMLDFARKQPAFAAAEMQNCLAQGGAFDGWLDGQVCVEQGFTRAPRILSSTVVPGAGSIAGAGVGPGDWNAYLYVAVYEWFDAQGNLHRSEPSVPFVVGVTLAQTNARIGLTIRTICTTRKGDRLDAGTVKTVRIALYRTQANTPETFYRVDDPTTLTIDNDPLYATRPASDTLSDAQLVAAQFGLLYTRGGVLDDSPPPPATALTVFRNRAWIASAEDGRAIWFSQLFFPGEAPRWNPALQLRVDASPSEITALAALRDQLVVFTQDRTYYVSGDGPNDTGAGGVFAGPFLLSESIGCVDHRSVVVFDGGAIFLAEPGFYLVSAAGLSMSFIGQPVRDTTRAYRTCAGAVHDPTRSRILWLLTDPVLLDPEPLPVVVVFDYLHNAWSTWTICSETGDVPLVHALWKGLHVWAGVEPEVASEGGALDPGDKWISGVVETPWLRLAGLMGYQRTRRVLLQGRLDSYCNLFVNLYVDQNETSTQQRIFVLDTGILDPPPVRGLEVHVARQKNRALKIRLYDTDASGGGGGFALVNISLEAGIKQGRDKLPLVDRR